MSVLAIRDLEVRRGARPVVRGVSLDVTRGEILAVMGASGAGKTSVLRAVAGLDPIAGGSVAVDGLQLSTGPLPRGGSEVWRVMVRALSWNRAFGSVRVTN